MSFGTEDIFKRLQEFLKNHQKEFDSPEAAVHFFMQQLNNENVADKKDNNEVSVENKSMELVEESQYATTEKQRRKLLTKALEFWPDNLDAQTLLIDGDVISQVEQLSELEKRARSKWLQTDQGGWLNPEERSYLRLKASYATFLKENGLLRDAEVVFEELFSLNEFDNQGTRYYLMSIYALTYNWRKAETLYRQVPYAEEDDQMVIPLLVLAILLRKNEMASQLFEKLKNINQDFKKIFKHEMFPIEEFLENSELPAYLPNSFESLSMALFNVLPLIVSSEYVYAWMLNEFKGNEGNFERGEPNNSNVIHFPEVDHHGSYYDEFEDDPLFGITGQQYEAFMERGLTSYEDFEELTIKEVLAIRMIGPSTIKQLLENDVVFKD